MSDYVLKFSNNTPHLLLTAPGPQGATGAGIKVLGELASTANLPALPNPNLNAGDAYIIAGSLWVYTQEGTFSEQAFLEGGVGPAGPIGPQGIQGPAGPQGIQGVAGPTGPIGPEGPQGKGIAVKGTLANTGLLPALPTAPEDAYIINGDLYVWDGDSWINAGAFRGPEGPVGPQGPQGIQGIKGDTGNTGPQGIQGITGPQGATGPTGSSAYQVAVAGGFVGTEAEWIASLEGAQGPQGVQGIQGIQGDQGPQGIAGTNGKNVVNSMFSAQGPVTVFDSTQKMYPTVAGNITAFRVTLGTAGTTSTVVRLKKNGTGLLVYTLTLASGVTTEVAYSSVGAAVTDYFTVEVQTAGTGAADLTVQTRTVEL